MWLAKAVPHKAALLAQIAQRSARVGVIGLGYVGLPLALEFARAGFNTLGIENNSERANDINAGRSYIPDVAQAELAALVQARANVALVGKRDEVANMPAR